jgi:hypothetical protein
VLEGTRDLGVAIPGATGYRRRWWALAVLCLSLVVLAMDNTILNVALLSAFIQGMGDALQVGAGVAAFAALLVLLFPARATGTMNETRRGRRRDPAIEGE